MREGECPGTPAAEIAEKTEGDGDAEVSEPVKKAEGTSRPKRGGPKRGATKRKACVEKNVTSDAETPRKCTAASKNPTSENPPEPASCTSTEPMGAAKGAAQEAAQDDTSVDVEVKGESPSKGSAKKRKAPTELNTTFGAAKGAAQEAAQDDTSVDVEVKGESPSKGAEVARKRAEDIAELATPGGRQRSCRTRSSAIPAPAKTSCPNTRKSKKKD
eukprot:NODE_2071_length_994_cov_562.059259_g1692_i0.p1 GENE.NODE_2071_length_994_cov_562.059259_g1692_i0~~NODE_2071_length_994_cov_562.059259_g1692_i0.p1  ORF type:complete len:252 (+),score=55.18 NODE_2071_length_994_cov_562.059259_g1692_i0:111-758(+)